MKQKGETLMTRRQLAALTDLPGQDGPVHMMTVTKWERDGLPVAERGRKGKPSLYREVDCRAWLAARKEAAKNGSALDVAQERARKEHWQALLAEQLHKARERELLPRAEVERAWGAEVAAVRTRLLAWPTTLADRVHRAATLEGIGGVERALQEAVREVLRELASGSDQVAAPSGKRRARKGRAA
jgi:phage terminase Nu1 subunit (DNA packaging protein)